VIRPATARGVPNRSPESDAGVSADRIREPARELDVDLSAEQCAQLEHFARLLLRWNRTHNLTAITRADQVLTHHLLDSLSLVSELRSAAPLRILDAGAGAGLPGLPLAVALPEHRFTLIDAVAKKCAFMTQACLELALSNVQVLHQRLEQLQGAHFDVIVSRALGSLATFTSLTRHLLAPGGRWVAMKGVLPEDELQALPPDVGVARTVTLRVPRLDEARKLVVLQAR
jgi:16S rRNA (guanine527-N7)-methyltransferase